MEMASELKRINEIHLLSVGVSHKKILVTGDEKSKALEYWRSQIGHTCGEGGVLNEVIETDDGVVLVVWGLAYTIE
jgi:UDP-N-acetylglucosamine 2-epimerase